MGGANGGIDPIDYGPLLDNDSDAHRTPMFAPTRWECSPLRMLSVVASICSCLLQTCGADRSVRQMASSRSTGGADLLIFYLLKLRGSFY